MAGALVCPRAAAHMYKPRTCTNNDPCLLSGLFFRQTRGTPATYPIRHRQNIAVAHLLKIVRRKRGAKTASAIEHDFVIAVGNESFNIALKHTAANMTRSGRVPGIPFVVLSD